MTPLTPVLYGIFMMCCTIALWFVVALIQVKTKTIVGCTFNAPLHTLAVWFLDFFSSLSYYSTHMLISVYAERRIGLRDVHNGHGS